MTLFLCDTSRITNRIRTLSILYLGYLSHSSIISTVSIFSADCLWHFSASKIFLSDSYGGVVYALITVAITLLIAVAITLLIAVAITLLIAVAITLLIAIAITLLIASIYGISTPY